MVPGAAYLSKKWVVSVSHDSTSEIRAWTVYTRVSQSLHMPQDHKHLATKSFGNKLFANNIYWVKIFALFAPKKKKMLKYL